MLSLLVICLSLALAGASASPRGCDCVYDNDLGEVKQTEALLQIHIKFIFIIDIL